MLHLLTFNDDAVTVAVPDAGVLVEVFDDSLELVPWLI